MSTQDERQLATAHDQTRSQSGRENARPGGHTQRQTGALSCDKQYGWSSCLRTATVVIGTIWPRWPETEPVTMAPS